MHEPQVKVVASPGWAQIQGFRFAVTQSSFAYDFFGREWNAMCTFSGITGRTRSRMYQRVPNISVGRLIPNYKLMRIVILVCLQRLKDDL